jgi:hypothetical protein
VKGRFRVGPNESRVDVGSGFDQNGNGCRTARKVSGPVSRDVQQSARRLFVLTGIRRGDPRRGKFRVLIQQTFQGGDVSLVDRINRCARQRLVFPKDQCLFAILADDSVCESDLSAPPVLE